MFGKHLLSYFLFLLHLLHFMEKKNQMSRSTSDVLVARGSFDVTLDDGSLSTKCCLCTHAHTHIHAHASTHTWRRSDGAMRLSQAYHKWAAHVSAARLAW